MAADPIPTWQLYGEVGTFPDVLHVEQVADRASGLGWMIEPHRHTQLHQILLLTSGDIDLTLDGARQTVLPPAAVNIPPGAVHSFAFSPGTEGFVVTLPADDFAELFLAPAETAAALALPFASPAAPELCLRFQSLAAAHAGGPAYRRTLLRSEAAALLACVAGLAPDTGDRKVATDPRLVQFEALARSGISGRVPLDDLARRLGMSPRNLGRLCKAETGMSAGQYLLHQRLREACRLLAYTRLPAEQVAYQLGFEDPSYFSRVFRRVMKTSPRDYRKRF